ncbi:DNA recombination protein RmuC [Paracoccaceae bacterium]|jgi:DNA recombination protein RmuC|nr:DNA recombination protein RmuC [Paracoccaceae bacterium]MBT7399523.1 DNA recombination protein RmuC [Hellea sp.]MDA9122551.1 DNA recombination protein RmuC [Paracoccaceae bacterium]MDE2694044.1 DNA recombination protein RmuC [Paracoccaceae bacterium]|tara:strand:- start:380 stop:1522 length:1143 start_codon:yes stop_codon:yes gene_type:complete
MQDFVIDNLTLLILLIVGIALLLFLIKMAKNFSKPIEKNSLQDAILGLGEQVRILGEGQQQLTGSLRTITEAQSTSQTKLITVINERLAEVQNTMGESLQGSATKTARSLGELQQRLETIDKAQENIEKLSGNVLSLQDILSNKQTRGAFGEIQLEDIVSKALPPDSYSFQVTLSNGKRADCLLKLPNPPGSIVIDSKFPLEAYENLRNASNATEVTEAKRMMKTSVRAHIKAISEKYIIEGETADSAMMFLPSEAVYAELHANFPQVVREGFEAKVWIVSPTTCMATLNTMRAILKDARMREQAGAIRTELGLLFKDVERMSDRVMNLDRHFVMASKDIEEIKISAKRSGNRARKLDNFDFEEISVDSAVVPLPKTENL